MRHCISLLVILHLTFPVLSQMAAPSTTIVNKPVIDSAAIADWADLLWSEPLITPDGKYFMYPIDNLPVGSKTLVVQSTENEWKKEFVGAEKGFFSGHSKLAVFKKEDTLCLLSLGKDKVLSIGGIASYKNPKEGTGQWLAYLTKTNELTVYNLVTDRKQQYPNVWEYQFDNSGQVLLMKEKIKKDSTTSETVQWLTLATNQVHTIWQSADNKISTAKGFSFDEQGKQLVFIVENKAKGQLTNAVWYYREGTNNAVEKVTNETPGTDSGMMVSGGAPSFSKNGKYLFFKIQPLPETPLKPNPNGVQVDVWSYKDLLMQNIQLYNVKNPTDYSVSRGIIKEYSAAFCFESNQIFCLQKPGMVNELYPTTVPGDHVVVEQKKFFGNKIWLNEPASYYLVNIKDGIKTKFNSGRCEWFSFSPDDRYLIYYDWSLCHFMSYNILTKETKNISLSIPEQIRWKEDQGTKYPMVPVGIKGWFNKTTVVIYDNYDIWQVDITGKKAPVNLTNGYGKKHQIVFRLLDEYNLDKNILLAKDEQWVLVAFDEKTKQNGFFRLSAKHDDPKLLTLASYLFHVKRYQTPNGLLDMKPVKASKADAWVVKRQSASDAPNLFVTKDFMEYKQLTNMQPQKKYNWFSSELLEWEQLDGEYSQGVLYKPDNFDSTKKYPVIIFYYEQLSEYAHQFFRPDFMTGALNIPWFVSRGYLVFTPDIHYTIGKAGESVVNSVVSGVKYLFQFPFVDSTKVGIQGHSWGGYQTNYLVTHTKIFAAAVAAAGFSDFVSAYGSLHPEGAMYGLNFLEAFSIGQLRLQATPWEDQEAYISNSPIFHADEVTTPLLMMHNKNDGLVPWSQAVEFFIALRRLDKKVWMLQYDNGGHGTEISNDGIDYTKRMTQFFDHYLKGVPAPKWMTHGIPANLKGIDLGYELDYSGKQP